MGFGSLDAPPVTSSLQVGWGGESGDAPPLPPHCDWRPGQGLRCGLSSSGESRGLGSGPWHQYYSTQNLLHDPGLAPEFL